MELINSYYYGNEDEQYIFYRIPKAFFTEVFFIELSIDAKVLYGLMFDRMGLSIKNNWRDDFGRIYIYFTLKDIQKYIKCGHSKAIKVISELEKIDLIERIKQGQGKPTRIYVKKFFIDNNNTYPQKRKTYPQKDKDLLKEEIQTSTNKKSELPKIRSTDFLNIDTNNNNLIKNNFIKTDFNKSKSKSRLTDDNNNDYDIDIDNINEYFLSSSIIKKQNQLEEYIKEQINYNLLISNEIVEKDEVDSLILIIIDTLLSDSPTINVNGESKPQAIVKSMLMKIDYSSIIYVINKFKEQNHKISHKKSYLLTCLYNARMEGTYNGINYFNTTIKK